LQTTVDSGRRGRRPVARVWRTCDPDRRGVWPYLARRL